MRAFSDLVYNLVSYWKIFIKHSQSLLYTFDKLSELKREKIG